MLDKKVNVQTSTGKSLHAISWWLSYAEQTSEKLPDIDMQLTPFRYVRDIYDVRQSCPRHPFDPLPSGMP
eukprot:4621470-Pleurochrysis_carterae.AAC.1